MNLLEAWRILRLLKKFEDSDSVVCGFEGYDEYGIE